jgi:hypothetical protein
MLIFIFFHKQRQKFQFIRLRPCFLVLFISAKIRASAFSYSFSVLITFIINNSFYVNLIIFLSERCVLASLLLCALHPATKRVIIHKAPEYHPIYPFTKLLMPVTAICRPTQKIRKAVIRSMMVLPCEPTKLIILFVLR